MNFYYLDIKIESKSFANIISEDYFSSIRYGISSIEDKFKQNTQKFRFIKIKEYDQIQTKEDFILITSNIIFYDEDKFKIFLQILESSYIPCSFIKNRSLIFKGKKNELDSLINSDSLNKFNLPINFKCIDNAIDLKEVLSQNYNARFFNSIKKVNDVIIKKSDNHSKLKKEYLFFKNLPKSVKSYYAELVSHQESKNSFSYSIQAYDMLDVAYQFINNNLNTNNLKDLFNILEQYFEILFKDTKPVKKSDLDFIIDKNKSRFDDLKSSKIFNDLNRFLISHKSISLEQHFIRIQAELKNYKSIFLKSNLILSHGDLCFSNILFDKKLLEIKLIDPRGIDEKASFRSPYYDLAKLSHSLLGKYDFIINGLAKIEFDNDMKAFLDFGDQAKKTHGYFNIYKEFIDSNGLNFELVRLIESSLFLSMLTLHTENTKKVFSLALRSIEVFEDFKKN